MHKKSRQLKIQTLRKKINFKEWIEFSGEMNIEIKTRFKSLCERFDTLWGGEKLV